MRRRAYALRAVVLVSSVKGRLLCLLLSLLVGSEVAAQAGAKSPLPVPKISGRAFVGGSAKVTVTGSFQIDAELAINAKGSFGDGVMTHIGFGLYEEGAEAVITYGDQGIGLMVSVGKNSATAEPSAEDADCTGEVKVTSSSIVGQYTCTGVGSYNPATGKMGKVSITIRFTATS